MKKSIQILYLFLICFLISCNQHDSYEPTNNQPPVDLLYYVSGQITVDIGSIRYPLPNAKVQIGDKFTFTNSVGRFEISELPEGDYTVLITQTYIDSFYDRIKVTNIIGNANYTVKTNKIVNDYFPLNIGNEWYFTYYTSYSYPGDPTWDQCIGEEIWKILDIEKRDSTELIRVQNIFSGMLTSYKRDQSYKLDTLLISSDTTYFQIEQNDNSIHIGYQFSIDLPYSTHSFSIDYRYLSPVLGDTLIYYNNYGVVQKYVKDIGPIKLEYSEGGNHHWYGKIELTKFNIINRLAKD